MPAISPKTATDPNNLMTPAELSKFPKRWFFSANVRKTFMNQLGVALLAGSFPVFRLAYLGEGKVWPYASAVIAMMITFVFWVRRCATYPEKLADFLVSRGYVAADKRENLLNDWETGKVSLLHLLPCALGWIAMIVALILAAIKFQQFAA